jgi:hypothetical protein
MVCKATEVRGLAPVFDKETSAVGEPVEALLVSRGARGTSRARRPGSARKGASFAGLPPTSCPPRPQDPTAEVPEDSALLALLANVLDTVVDANEHAYQVGGGGCGGVGSSGARAAAHAAVRRGRDGGSRGPTAAASGSCDGERQGLGARAL